MGGLEGAGLAGAVMGVAPALDTEQFGLQMFRAHGRAVEDDEGAGASPRTRMQHPRHHFLAHPGGSRDQDAAARRGNAIERRAHLVDGRGLTDQLGLVPRLETKFRVLAAQPGRFDRALDDQQQAVRLEGLLDVIVSAALNRRHRRLDVAMAADHHHRQIGRLAL